MNANEMVIVARLATHYESVIAPGHDPLETAKRDVQKIKREAPDLWRCLWQDSSRTDRQIGDYLFVLVRRFLVQRDPKTGLSFKNFLADEFERRGCR